MSRRPLFIALLAGAGGLLLSGCVEGGYYYDSYDAYPSYDYGGPFIYQDVYVHDRYDGRRRWHNHDWHDSHREWRRSHEDRHGSHHDWNRSEHHAWNRGAARAGGHFGGDYVGVNRGGARGAHFPGGAAGGDHRGGHGESRLYPD